ncbi:MAG: FAD-dependent oxidoreductase [Acidimicrobiales bacterium]
MTDTFVDWRDALARFAVSPGGDAVAAPTKSDERRASAKIVAGVAVIGAGVVGLAVAQRLAEEADDVLLIEAGAPRFGSSMANAGHLVTASHVLPFARPGVIRTGVASLVKRDGALAFNARNLTTVLPWFASFVRSCSKNNLLRATPALLRLSYMSSQALDELTSSTGLTIRSAGLLEVYFSTRALRNGLRHASELGNLGVRHEEVDADLVSRSSPLLRMEPAGALRFCDDKSVDPSLLWQTLKAEATAKGVGLLVATAKRIVREEGSVTIETELGPVRARRAVIAAGAWSGALVRQLGVRTNLTAAKGYSITLQGLQDRLAEPMLLFEPHLAVNPLEQGLRVSARYEVTSPSDRNLSKARVKHLLQHAARYLDIGDGSTLTFAWTGNRPATSDGFPMIGSVPSTPEVVVCSGHGMTGSSTALGSAALVADLLAGRPVPSEVTVLAPGRWRR